MYKTIQNVQLFTLSGARRKSKWFLISFQIGILLLFAEAKQFLLRRIFQPIKCHFNAPLQLYMSVYSLGKPYCYSVCREAWPVMVGALDSRATGRGSSPGWGLCFVLCTLLSQCFSPPRCINEYWRTYAGGGGATLQKTSIPSRRSRNPLSRFMLQKPG